MEGKFCRGKTKEWNLQNSFLPILDTLAFPSSPLFWRKTSIPSFTDFPIIFPLSCGLTFNSCIYCDTNTAFAIFLSCLAPSIPHSTPAPRRNSSQCDSQTSLVCWRVWSQQFHIHKSPSPATQPRPQGGEREAQFQGFSIGIEISVVVRYILNIVTKRFPDPHPEPIDNIVFPMNVIWIDRYVYFSSFIFSFL